MSEVASKKYFNYRAYIFGLLVSGVFHLAIAVLAIVMLEKTKAQAIKPSIVYTVTLEGSPNLGGKAILKKGKKGKSADLSKEKLEKKISKEKVQDDKKIEKGKDLVALKKKEDKEKEEKKKAELKKVKEEKLKKKKQEEEKKKKAQKLKKEETKKKAEAEKKLKEAEEKKAKAEVEKKKKAAEDKKKKAHEKKVAELKKRKAESDFNELINKSRNRKTSEESYDAGGRGLGSAVRGAGNGRGGGVVRDFEFVAYQQKLIAHIKDGWRWSQGNDRLSAIVGIQISKSGAVNGVRISESSGNTGFDDSVVRAVKKASPLPPPPSKYYNDFKEVRITFDDADT